MEFATLPISLEGREEGGMEGSRDPNRNGTVSLEETLWGCWICPEGTVGRV